MDALLFADDLDFRLERERALAQGRFLDPGNELEHFGGGGVVVVYNEIAVDLGDLAPLGRRLERDAELRRPLRIVHEAEAVILEKDRRQQHLDTGVLRAERGEQPGSR